MRQGPQVPRTPEAIQRVIDTIGAKGQRIKCPVCASPMLETEPYGWECKTDHCPISGVDFNQRIHNYGISSRANW